MLDDSKKATLLTKFFLSKGRLVRYKKGELINNDNRPHEIYMVEKGHIKVYSISDDGDKFVHIVYKKGEIFPVIWGVRVQRVLFYEAMDNSALWRVDRQDYIKFMNASVETATSIIAQIAQQYNAYADRVDNLEYKRVSERVAYYLLFLAYRFGRKTADGIMIDAPFTQQDIADAINVARESVSREFERLQRKGAVTLVRRQIIIKDASYLASRINESFSLEAWDLA